MSNLCGNGEITHESLDMLAKDDPVTCAVYAREKTYQIFQNGRDSSLLPREKRRCYEWSTRINSDHTITLLNINLDSISR